MGPDPILLESSSEQEIWTQWMHINGKKKKIREDGGRGRPSTNQGEKKKTNNIL